VREWKGRLERVMVLEEGFAWNGQTFGSLSQIAQKDDRDHLEWPPLLRASPGKDSRSRRPNGQARTSRLVGVTLSNFRSQSGGEAAELPFREM
jgi:hypothetical protein